MDLDALRTAFEGKIVRISNPLCLFILTHDQDFKGQHLADQVSQFTLIIFAIVAFLVGYVTQNIVTTFWIMTTGTTITLLVYLLFLQVLIILGRCTAVAILPTKPREMAVCKLRSKGKIDIKEDMHFMIIRLHL